MLGEPELIELRSTARTLARLGGQTARRFFGRVVASRKPDDTPVTDADHAAQQAILDVLARRHPTHAILVEETVPRPERHAVIEDAEYCWVIDPLDGTRNFARGIAVYATSVAVLHRGAPVAGAVYDATTGRTYSAAHGQGAFVEDERLDLRSQPLNSDTTVMISSFRRRAIPAAVRRWMDAYLFRNLGSLCLHLVWVAAGSAEAAYALECKLWDLAAAALIIEEAGGLATDHAGQPLWPIDPAAYDRADMPILAGSSFMHARLLSSLLGDAARD